MAWYDEAVFYHIYPLGLLDAPKQNSYSKPVHRLKELNSWIEHIKKIGCNALYIGPLFESVGHGYETTDYRKLDSRLGDNKDLKDFVSRCHKAGIKVIFDGVFNHTGRDFFAFKDIQTNREQSKYRDWYYNVNFYGNNEYNDGFSYDNWGGYNLLVKLNQRNSEVVNYICDVIRFWVSEFDVDGIRLDAADVLDFEFMKALRHLANEVKPDFWLMGEVIHGDYTRWVNGDTLHSVTNYVLHKALYSGHNDHNYYEIAHTIRRLNDMARVNPNGLKLYNFTDNHDVERIASKLNNKANYMPVHILEYTLPGVPSVYYGSEFGIEGRKEQGSDASLRPALKLEDYKDAYENNPYTALICALGQIRQNTPALSYGNYEEKLLTNRQFAFCRNYEESTVVVMVNNDENPCEINLNGIRNGEYKKAFGGETVTVSNGTLYSKVSANSGEIYILNGEVFAPSIEIRKEEKTICKEEKPVFKEEKPIEPKLEKPVEMPKAPAKTVKTVTDFISAREKYNLSEKYDAINPELIDSRQDYEAMSIEELQVAILEKMAHNGPVNDQMIKTVMDNVYPNSLLNWVRSFR